MNAKKTMNEAMTLTETRRALEGLGTVPTKSLGQNFLHDQNLARTIVSHLDIQPGDHIVEIGPGLGALTGLLADAATRLTVIEKDARLVPHLQSVFAASHISIHHMDALDFDLRSLWGYGPVKVVGNLPYYISSPLIAKYSSALSPASMLVLTLQLELAQRLGASRGSKDYGAMTICVGRRWGIRFERKLPASVFHPRPKVDSAVITMRRKTRAELQPINEEVFESLVRRGFSSRRKQLHNLLPELRPDWESLCARIGVAPGCRAEELSLEQWESLTHQAAPATAQHGGEMFDVVDDQDRVLRQESREVVHVNNLLHRAVHMLVFNELGELFLQKRSLWKDRNPGLWDSSAAGHVDAGEDYPAAAARELSEELGIAPPPLTGIGRLPPCASTGWEFIEVYRAIHNGPFHPAPLELETGAFFALGHIRQWAARSPADFSPVFLKCLALLETAQPVSNAQLFNPLNVSA